jgi:hypothetical protein
MTIDVNDRLCALFAGSFFKVSYHLFIERYPLMVDLPGYARHYNKKLCGNQDIVGLN